ncbi:MAG: hypothetical protein ACXWK9_02400 [Myxococcaceae bacterium]
MHTQAPAVRHRTTGSSPTRAIAGLIALTPGWLNEKARLTHRGDRRAFAPAEALTPALVASGVTPAGR